MKRKFILMLLMAISGICVANAQEIIIVNQTGCDLMIYSGEIVVNGTDYMWGSEIPGNSMSYGQTTAVFTTQSGFPTMSPAPPAPPMYTQKIVGGSPTNPIVIPYNPSPSANQYIGFKFRQPNIGSGSGYVSAANPVVQSSPPVGCNGGSPLTVKWTGAPNSPTVLITP